MAAEARALIDGNAAQMRLRGDWTLRALSADIVDTRRRLCDTRADTAWDLRELTRLDSFGATLLWHSWGGRWPAQIELNDSHRDIIDQIARASARTLPRPAPRSLTDRIAAVGRGVLGLFAHGRDFVALLGRMVLDTGQLLRDPRDWPLLEISANVYKVGVKAMPVTALVGFLIGVVLSYLSALQLKVYGADVFIVNILGLGIVRELGPVLVSILVAGRSGSAMTAQLGVMRVTEEIDALAAMGVSRSVRLILPKVLALGIAMPLLVLWTSAVALFGGWVSAWVELDLSFAFFFRSLPDAVPIANVFIGLSKGAVFGLLIALIACHFGLRVRPNTESLSANTTASVVSAITMVILVDAVFAIATRSLGIPG